MGCITTKLSPEEPFRSCVVDSVVEISRSNNNLKKEEKTEHSSENQQSKRRLNKKQVKIQKYQARFHPKLLAKYDMKALLGKGSFSRVLRVEHRISKQPYAIKMIEKQGTNDTLEELKILQRIQHDYIIKLIEVIDTPRKVYIVMELATGGDLYDRIVTRSHFPEEDAKAIIRMLLEGVRYLHSIHITHRDLKPENLLYYHPGNDSKLMIADFGLSRFNNNDKPMKTICGTAEYISPELVAKEAYTNKIDLWAVGVISYLLLSGVLPFYSDHKSRLLKKIISGKFEFDDEKWKSISDDALNFISSLLVIKPQDRMSANEALKHKWIREKVEFLGNSKVELNGEDSDTESMRQLKLFSEKISKQDRRRSSLSSNRSRRTIQSLGKHRKVSEADLNRLHKSGKIKRECSVLSNTTKLNEQDELSPVKNDLELPVKANGVCMHPRVFELTSKMMTET